jgi:biotin-dependent carboxylase-like uncharacterized protein
MVMGSRSTFQRGGFGGLDGRALAAGDKLPVGQASDSATTGSTFHTVTVADRAVPQALAPAFSSSLVVRAIPSHETDLFTTAGLERFFSASYTVSQKSDRMGCRLEGPVIEHSAGADIVSSGVQTGTVQVPGDGQPIVLMADRQTTGGYTRIAQVIRADLPLLGQARPGDTVRFIQCTPAEAALALAVQRQSLQQVQADSLKAAPALARNPGITSAGTRHFRVDIGGQSYMVTLEEM